MFISPAYAQAAAEGGGSGLVTLLPLVLIFVVFYFLLIRPQQKKMKQHKAMVGAVRRGDKVVTAGGLFATVTKIVDENELHSVNGRRKSCVKPKRRRKPPARPRANFWPTCRMNCAPPCMAFWALPDVV